MNHQSPFITAALLGCAGLMFLFAVLFVRAMSYGPRNLAPPAAVEAARDAGAVSGEVRRDPAKLLEAGATVGGAQARREASSRDAGAAQRPSQGAAPGPRSDAGATIGSQSDAGGGLSKEKLVERLKEQLVPSLLMCLQDRVNRGDSYRGEVRFEVRLTRASKDQNLAVVELVSVDGPEMKKADYDCIWPNVEDVSLKLGQEADALEGQASLDASFGIAINLTAPP